MIDFLLHPDVSVFSGTLAVVLVFALIELLSAVIVGASPSQMADGMLDTAELPSWGLLNWLMVREVPLLVGLMTLLTGFGATGWIVQGIAQGLQDAPLPLMLASWFGVSGALVSARLLNSVLRKLKFTSTKAISRSELIGQQVVLVSAMARRGLPGEAKFIDRHGQSHYMLVQPAADEQELTQGDTLVLLELDGATYEVQRLER